MKGDKSATTGAAPGHAWQVSARTVDMTRPVPAVRALAIDADPQNIVVDANKSALLIVDMQNDFCAKGGWIDSMEIDVSPNRRPIQPLKRLIKAFRAHAMPVIWVNWAVRKDLLNISPSLRHAHSPSGASRALARRCQDRARRSWQRAAGARRWSTRSIPAGQRRADHQASLQRLLGHRDGRRVAQPRHQDAVRGRCEHGSVRDDHARRHKLPLLRHGAGRGRHGDDSPDYCVKGVLFNVKRLFGFIVRSEAILRVIKSA